MWTAFFIGFLGGFHCMLMCGPLVLFLRHNRNNYSGRHFITHQFSRLLGYSILGALAGSIGYGFSLASLHRYVALVLGGLLLYIALASLLPNLKLPQPKNAIYFNNWLSLMYSRLSTKSFIPLGVLNALLPCGLVYTALAASTAFFDPIKGALFMCFFGLGTLPAMGIVYLLPTSIMLPKKKLLRFALPLTTAFVGILLILRGLAIGVPLLSPASQQLNVMPHSSQYNCVKTIELHQGVKKIPLLELQRDEILVL